MRDTSPGKLFIAGVLPGLFVAFLLVVWCAWKSPRTQHNDSFSLKLALLKTLQSLPDLILPIVVLGGIYLGVYTPTEAAAVGVIYALFLTMVIRRTIKPCAWDQIAGLPYPSPDSTRDRSIGSPFASLTT